MKRLLLLLIFLPLCNASAFGQDRLTGLTGVCVRASILSYNDSGLSAAELQTDTESALRKASIMILEGSAPTASKPCLSVTVTLLKTSAGDYVANAVVELTELATPRRRQATDVVAVTWGRGAMLQGNRNDALRNVRDEISAMVNHFATAYLKANPKPNPN
jgi:hypothetical protein